MIQKVVSRNPLKETIKHVFVFVLPQCDFLNPFILKRHDLVMLWFLSLTALLLKVWSPDQAHPSITWELVVNADYWVLLQM